MINKYILDIYIQFMEFRLRPLGFMDFFKNSMKPKGRSLNSLN